VQDVPEERLELPGASRLAWSGDGRLLAVATSNGEVNVYVCAAAAFVGLDYDADTGVAQLCGTVAGVGSLLWHTGGLAIIAA
jgi:hypothetical protein